MTASLRRQLIDTARAMNDSKINTGTSGNLSVRYDHGILITPSGKEYDLLQAEDIVFLDMAGLADGIHKPSSEWRFHRDIYAQRPDARAIVHAHPVHCTALACLQRPIPAFHYMVAVAGGRDIRCARYATFGTQTLSDNVLEAIDNRKACLMANHGLVCLEEDLPAALALAMEVEQLAHIYCHCLATGEAKLLDDAEMDVILEKFKTYGTNAART
jgi:L-fuculose-phosphate aldolase